MGAVMQTYEFRVLTNRETNAEDIVRYLLGDKITKPTVYGACELDAEGIPVAPIPVKRGVNWDGHEVEATGLTYSMTTPNDGRPHAPKVVQPVIVYEYRDGETNVVMQWERAITVINGEPMPATVQTPDHSKMFATYGPWVPIEGLWVCPARVESV